MDVTTTPDGYIGHRRFIKNAQPLAPGIWLAETQRSHKGKGKIWYMGLIRTNPEYRGDDAFPEFIQFGVCRVATSQWRLPWKVFMWGQCTTVSERPRSIEAYFEDSMVGIQFMVRNAVEFIK